VQRVLAAEHPGVRLLIHEHEPFEAFALLDADDVDLALMYDYNLAPLAFAARYETRPLWTVPWGVGVPAGMRLDDAWRADWVVNSRNTADEDVVRTIASLAGFRPRVTHRADSLELVQDLIAAGLGVGLLPADLPTRTGVTLCRLAEPGVALRSYAVIRRGRARWPPLALVLDRLTSRKGPIGG
jgi:DNA-binding transcriptional LysR family regulator